MPNLFSGRGLRRAQRRRGVASLRRAEAAARCGSFPEPQMQNSRFKIKWIFRARLGTHFDSGYGIEIVRAVPQPSGRACNEQREIAALRQGTAAARCGLPEAANSRFKIQNLMGSLDTLGHTCNSGCSLRRTRTFGHELRASAAPPGLRPADRGAIDSCDRAITSLQKSKPAVAGCSRSTCP